MRKALILVDIQNGFCAGGNLAVPHGEEVVEFANKLKGEVIDGKFSYDVVIGTQDWHPSGHGSFASVHDKDIFSMHELDGLPQVMWPDHCVMGTKDAEFHPDLDLHRVTVFRKGIDPMIDSYSGFYDNGHRRSTGLKEYLQSLDVNFVSCVGLALDYCVGFTAMDAIKCGFETEVIVEGCRAVNINAGDDQRMLKQLEDLGVKIK